MRLSRGYNGTQSAFADFNGNGIRKMIKRLARTACVVVGTASLAGAGPARVHPLHTTLTQIAGGPGRATLWVRAFADDFALGVAANRAPAGADAAQAYLAASVAVWDRAGRRQALAPCGSRRSGDLLWYCLRAQTPGGLSGARVLNRMQFGVYDDQVNVVQAEYGGRKTSLLFVPGDGPKRLP